MDARRRVQSGSPYEDTIGFCRAIRVGDHIAVSGTAPIWADGGCDPDVGAQAARCFEIALAAVYELGGDPRDVVRTRMFLTDAADAETVGQAHAVAFGAAQPAATMVVVAALLDPRWKVEVEVDAVVG